MTGRAVGLACVCACAFAPAFASPADDLANARRALRDAQETIALGLADAAAAAATNASERADARLVALEALACAKRRRDVLARLDSWGDEAVGDAFRQWRAWALLGEGRAGEARAVLEAPMTDPAVRPFGLRLAARACAALGDAKAADALFAQAEDAAGTNRVARADNAREWASVRLADGDVAGARAVLEKEALAPGPSGDAVRLDLASLCRESGEVAAAKRIWRQLWNGTNVVGSVRRKAGFQLAFAEFHDGETRRESVERIRRLVKSAPDDPDSRDAQIRLADALLVGGDAEAAEREYRLFLEMYPETPETAAHVLEGRGWAMLKLGRRKEAAGLFARAERAAPDAAFRCRCLFKLGDALAADGKFEQAASAYHRAAEGEANAAHARYREADALSRGGKDAESRAVFESLVSGGGPFGAKASLRLAAKDLADGLFERALGRCSKLLEDESVSADLRALARVFRARAHYRAKRFSEALADFGAVERELPDRADEMRFLRVLCLYGDGAEKDARSEARQLLASSRDPVLRRDVARWLAKIAYNDREWDEAQRRFEACAKEEPDPVRKASDLYWAARAAAARPNPADAVKLVSAAAMSSGVFPERTAALILQGQSLVELARFADAVLVFDGVLRDRASGESARRALILKGDALFAMGADNGSRYAQALETYRAAKAMEDLSPEERLAVDFKIARALDKLGREDEAEEQYYRSVILAYGSERRRNAWFGGDETSRAFFSRAAFELADRYEARGRFDRAAGVLRRVVEARIPSSGAARKRLERIREKGGAR